MGSYAPSGDSLNALGQDIGAPVTYNNAFLQPDGWAAIDSSAVIDWYLWDYPGYEPVWNVPMLPMVSYLDTTSVGGTSLTTEATGAYNQYFVLLARELVAAGQGHSYVRLGWEMNGSWYPWSEDRCPGKAGKSSCYVTAWDQIVTAMRSVPGAHFSYEWVPYGGNTSAMSAWPGKAYVDVIGLDIYDWNYGGQVAFWSHQLTDVTGLDWLRHTAQKMKLPETIAEWGLTSATKNMNLPVCYFVAKMVDWIYGHNVVNANVWDNWLTNPHFAWALRHYLRDHLTATT